MGCDFFMNPPPDEYESYADQKEKRRKKERAKEIKSENFLEHMEDAYQAIKKVEQPSSGPRPQAPPTYLIESLVRLLATNPLPLTPVCLTAPDPDGVLWTVMVRRTTKDRIEVTFDRRDPS